MGTLLWNLVAIASWLAEVGAATLLWLAGGPAALLWVLECGCLVQCFNRLVVATVLWVADRGYHGTVGNGMRLPWCSGEQSVVVMVAEYETVVANTQLLAQLSSFRMSVTGVGSHHKAHLDLQVRAGDRAITSPGISGHRGGGYNDSLTASLPLDPQDIPRVYSSR